MQLEWLQQRWDWVWKNIQDLEALAALIVIVASFFIWLLTRDYLRNKSQESSTRHSTTFEKKVKVNKDFVMGDKTVNKTGSEDNDAR